MPSATHGIHLETTKKSVVSTIADIKKVIMKGAMRGVVTGFQEDYDSEGNISAVRFIIRTKQADIPYLLPCRAGWIFDRLQEGHEGRNVDEDYKKSQRIAWRQTFDWMRATVGMVDQGQLKPQEAFFAFAVGKNGQTLFENVEQAGYRGLLPESSLRTDDDDAVLDADFEEG